MIQQAMAADALLMKDLEDRQRQLAAETASLNSAKQTQSEPAQTQTKPRLIHRSAPCPCKSGQKYKRCCGRNAPPVLFGAAA
jgi:preprotein translocase subunit SecA